MVVYNYNNSGYNISSKKFIQSLDREKKSILKSFFYCVTGIRQLFYFIILSIFLPFLSAEDIKKSPNDNNVLRRKLDNGLEVIIIRNPVASVASVIMNYKVGSRESPEGFPGMAHAEEHMMFRGNPGLSSEQLAEIIAALGGQFNALTRQMLTQYFFTVPSEDIEIVLKTEACRMSGILNSEKLWDKERKALLEEIAQDLSDPEYIFYRKLLEIIFKGTVYAYDALGTKESFNKTTGAMLKKFFENWYVPNNAILVIAGDVPLQETFEKVKRIFKSIPGRPLPPKVKINFNPVKNEKIRLKTDQPYGMAVIAFRMPGTDDKDYAATKILVDILNSQRGELYGLVPEGKALNAGFFLYELPEASLGYALGTFPSSMDGEALLKDIENLLIKIAKEGVSPDLFHAAKAKALARFAFDKNSIFRLAMRWSEALAVEGRESPSDDFVAIEKTKETDVHEAAKRYLTMRNAVFAILTPQQSGEAVVSEGFHGKEPESRAESLIESVKLPSWAKNALRKLSVPRSTVNPVISKLENGLTLIIQPVSLCDTISVYGSIKNNPYMQTPPGKEGINEIVNDLFSFGTVNLDRLAFQKALDDIAANETAGLNFYVEILSKDFERGVQLLAENQLSPAFPPESFDIVRKQTAALVEGRIKSPEYIVNKAIKSSLVPPKDPTLREATPSTVRSLKYNDVIDYYNSVFRPDMTAIVVIGNVDPFYAQEIITKYFASWKAKGLKPDTDLPGIPANKPSVIIVPNQSRIQDKVYLTSTLGLVRSDPDFYALELGNHVLGGAFYATRFYRDLRKEGGLVYYVSSSFDIGKTRSFYSVEYACAPANVSKARSIIVSNLKEMMNKQISGSELLNAKAILLREIPLRESSIEAVAWGILDRINHDLPVDEPVKAAKRYINITAKEIMETFSRWVRPDDLVEVREGPQIEQ